MSEPRTTRPATAGDAEACAAIYAPYVEDTAISFEERPPSVTQMRARIERALDRHAWVVLEEGARVIGYAYGGPYKDRPAYRWSCEVSVYVALGSHRSGAGRALYVDLFERLAERGFLMAVAGMALPNPASEALHASLGFEPVGTWRRIGWKAGRWRDVHWMQRALGPAPADPVDPV